MQNILDEITRRTKKSVYEYPFSEESIFSFYQQLTAKIYNSFNPTGKFFLYYTKEDKINAYAMVIDQSAVVCLTTGTITKVYDCIYQLCENPSFFSNIGNMKTWYRYDGIRNSPVINGDQVSYSSTISMNPIRHAFADVLASYAILFLLLHELGHHLDGHIKFLSHGKESSAFLAMAGEHLCTKTNILDLKTIEMDADAFSCSYLAAQFCDIDNNEDYALNYFAEETESKLTILISSITILFFLLDSLDYNIDTNNLQKMLYLPISYRASKFYDNFYTFISKFKPETISETRFFVLAQQIQMGVLEIWFETFGKVSMNSIIMHKDRDALISQYSELSENWHQLREKLLPYADIELAPINRYITIENGIIFFCGVSTEEIQIYISENYHIYDIKINDFLLFLSNHIKEDEFLYTVSGKYNALDFLSGISNSDFYNLQIPENRFQELLSAWLSNEKFNL